MARTGSPQYFALNSILVAGTAGSADEVDRTGAGSLLTGIWAESLGSHNVTAGPTTTGPVEVTVNGVKYELPFNTGTQFYPHVLYALQNASAAGWVAS